MIPTNLTTNEVKNSAGTEEEFLRQSTEGRKVVFAKNGEVPNQPHRITVQHSEVGVGAALRRRSVVRVDKTVAGVSSNPRVVSAYVVVDLPVGDSADDDDFQDVLANLMSFVASTGADSTIKFDCSGYGAAALVGGSC